MNKKSKDQTEQSSNNPFENKIFRKNAFTEENKLLPKSLLKDLIEDESSCESQGDSLINDSSSFYPENFDSFLEGLENQATNAFTNYAPEELKLRASTFNEVENARKSFKITETFGANTNNKFFKAQSLNDYQNYPRPIINNLNNANTFNNSNIISNNINNNLNNNNFFNESRNFCEEQNYMGKMHQANKINNKLNNNPNPQNTAGKLNAFGSLTRASAITQNNCNNFHSNIPPQKPINMRLNPMQARNNFQQQANTNFNCQGCLGNNGNCFPNNCYSDLSANNNFGGCSNGKNHLNQICLCPNCVDDSAYMDENISGYYPNINNAGNSNNFNGCLNNNGNMLGGPQQHNNYMNYNQQQNFEKGNLTQCRTFHNVNVNHPNFNLENGNLNIIFLNSFHFVII